MEEFQIERRYYRGLKNLFDVYLPVVDEFMIFDNLTKNSLIIAELDKNCNEKIYLNEIIKKMKELSHVKK